MCFATSVQVAAGAVCVPFFLLEEFGIEVGGGLGPMAGKVWRIGLMGHGCTRPNVELCLRGIEAALAEQGVTASHPAS